MYIYVIYHVCICIWYIHMYVLYVICMYMYIVYVYISYTYTYTHIHIHIHIHNTCTCTCTYTCTYNIYIYGGKTLNPMSIWVPKMSPIHVDYARTKRLRFCFVHSKPKTSRGYRAALRFVRKPRPSTQNDLNLAKICNHAKKELLKPSGYEELLITHAYICTTHARAL